MTPGTLVFAFWEGSAAFGLTIEYALMPEQCHSEEKRDLFERYTAVYGPWHLAAVVTGLWCALGPLMLVTSTLPKLLGWFVRWSSETTERLRRRTEELRLETALLEDKRQKLIAWCLFNKRATSSYETAICPDCGAPWPFVGFTRSDVDCRILRDHPGPDLETCPGSKKTPTSQTFYPVYEKDRL